MDMTLSDGFLASYSCGVRLWVSYLTTVLFFGAIVTVAIVVIELMAQRKADPYGHAHSAIRPDPKAKTITVTLLAFVAASVLLLSLVIPLSRSRTRLFATETSIVETGCHVLTPYREVLDRNLVEFRYRYGRGNKNDFDELELHQNGKRPLGIGLRGSSYLKNLVALAPAAMDQYFEQLKAEGKAVPGPCQAGR